MRGAARARDASALRARDGDASALRARRKLLEKISHLLTVRKAPAVLCKTLAEMLCQPRSRTGGARRQPEPRERERAEQREARRARYNVLVVRVAKSAPDVGEGLGRALRPLALHVGGELRRLACLAEQEHLFGREEKRPPCSVGLAK